MTNKQNSIVFIIVGTIIEVAITLLLMVIFFIIDLLIFKDNQQVFMILMMVLAFAAIGLGMFIYQKLATWFIAKKHLEDKLDPLFSNRFKKRNRLD